MAMRLIDESGKRYGNTLVLKHLRTDRKNSWWLCRCEECGAEFEKRGSGLRSHDNGCPKCGNHRNLIHGHRRNSTGSGTPTYISWRRMKDRCLNPNAKSYLLYGGRGVQVCEAWLASFMTFLADMGERPEGTTLDRIDPEGNYEPNNCRWADPKTQAANRRKKATHVVSTASSP